MAWEERTSFVASRGFEEAPEDMVEQELQIGQSIEGRYDRVASVGG